MLSGCESSRSPEPAGLGDAPGRRSTPWGGIQPLCPTRSRPLCGPDGSSRGTSRFTPSSSPGTGPHLLVYREVGHGVLPVPTGRRGAGQAGQEHMGLVLIVFPPCGLFGVRYAYYCARAAALASASCIGLHLHWQLCSSRSVGRRAGPRRRSSGGEVELGSGAGCSAFGAGAGRCAGRCPGSRSGVAAMLLSVR